MSKLFEYVRDQAIAGDPSEWLYNEARAKRMRATAELTQLELRAKRGELLKAARVDREVMNVLSAVRNHLLGIPSRVMHQLVGKTNPTEINMIVRDEVHRALREVPDFGDAVKSVRRLCLPSFPRTDSDLAVWNCDHLRRPLGALGRSDPTLPLGKPDAPLRVRRSSHS